MKKKFVPEKKEPKGEERKEAKMSQFMRAKAEKAEGYAKGGAVKKKC